MAWELYNSVLAGASTDEGGSYRIEGVPPGSVYVLASHPDYATAKSPELEVIEGKEYSGIELVLGDGGSIEGYIMDNGIPLPGQMISFSAMTSSELVAGESKSLGPRLFVQTDDRGYYHRDKLMPGSYLLAADIPTRRADVTDGRVTIGEVVKILEGRTTTFDIGLCEGGYVRGKVITEWLVPPGTFDVRIDLRSGNASDTWKHGRNVQSTRPGADSSFTFDNICPGEYTIMGVFLVDTPKGKVTQGASPQITIEVKEGRTTEMDLNFWDVINE